MSKFRKDDCIYLSADAEHPVSSQLCKDGHLSQQGISAEGFQREVGVRRRTENGPKGQRFCWSLMLYQHPGMRHEIPLGCSKSTKETTAPENARRMARAWHQLAESGVDPRVEGGRGNARGQLWHQIMLPALCAGGTEKSITRVLKDYGLWGRESVNDPTEGLGRARARRRRR